MRVKKQRRYVISWFDYAKWHCICNMRGQDARHVWDQTIWKIGLGEQVEDDGGNEAKLQPLFTKGVGKKKEPGRSLWSDEGI